MGGVGTGNCGSPFVPWRLSLILLGRYLGWPDGLTQAYPPGVFVYQMAGAASRGRGIGRTIIEGLRARGVIDGVKGAVNMAILAILNDDKIGLF